jgi:hypothetical protein
MKVSSSQVKHLKASSRNGGEFTVIIILSHSRRRPYQSKVKSLRDLRHSLFSIPAFYPSPRTRRLRSLREEDNKHRIFLLLRPLHPSYGPAVWTAPACSAIHDALPSETRNAFSHSIIAFTDVRDNPAAMGRLNAPKHRERKRNGKKILVCRLCWRRSITRYKVEVEGMRESYAVFESRKMSMGKARISSLIARSNRSWQTE